MTRVAALALCAGVTLAADGTSQPPQQVIAETRQGEGGDGMGWLWVVVVVVFGLGVWNWLKK